MAQFILYVDESVASLWAGWNCAQCFAAMPSTWIVARKWDKDNSWDQSADAIEDQVEEGNLTARRRDPGIHVFLAHILVLYKIKGNRRKPKQIKGYPAVKNACSSDVTKEFLWIYIYIYNYRVCVQQTIRTYPHKITTHEQTHTHTYIYIYTHTNTGESGEVFGQLFLQIIRR